MEVSEVKRLKELETGNRKLKQLIGRKKLDIIAPKAALSRKYCRWGISVLLAGPTRHYHSNNINEITYDGRERITFL